MLLKIKPYHYQVGSVPVADGFTPLSRVSRNTLEPSTRFVIVSEAPTWRLSVTELYGAKSNDLCIS